MNKNTTQMIKGIAIMTMIMHHFIVITFTELPYIIILFGYACKICVAFYAVLSGYGYFFSREKTVRYGMKKIGDYFRFIGVHYSLYSFQQLWRGGGKSLHGKWSFKCLDCCLI